MSLTSLNISSFKAHQGTEPRYRHKQLPSSQISLSLPEASVRLLYSSTGENCRKPSLICKNICYHSKTIVLSIFVTGKFIKCFFYVIIHYNYSNGQSKSENFLSVMSCPFFSHLICYYTGVILEGDVGKTVPLLPFSSSGRSGFT